MDRENREKAIFLNASKIFVRQATASDASTIIEMNVAAFGQKDEADLVEAIVESKHFIPAPFLVALSSI